MTFLLLAAAAMSAATPKCSYIGDSIAVGLESVDSKCAVHARVGANSRFIARNYAGQDGDEYTVISMGSNDPLNKGNFVQAVALRKSLTKAQLVIWILPRNRTAAAMVRDVAGMFNDNYIDLAAYRSRDGVHPSNYRAIRKTIDEHVLHFYD